MEAERTINYAARDKMHTVISEAFKSAEKEKINQDTVYNISIKSLLSVTIFIMMVSGVTSLAVVSSYCAFMGHSQIPHETMK